MAGLSRIIAKELSSMLGITDNPKFNPMFKQTDEALADVSNPDTPTIAEFYSPLESAIENASISEARGTKGENIEAFVRKRAPKVSKGEMEFRDFKLDPEERYTRGKALEESMLEPMEISALRKGTKERGTQRQFDLIDSEVGYEEIGVDVRGKDLGLVTHYGTSNLAHTRYSLRRGRAPKIGMKLKDIKSYILIEELQSDAIQNMSKNPTKDAKKLLDDFTKDFDSDMEDIAFKPQFQSSEKVIEDYKDFVMNDFIPLVSNKNLSEEKAFESLTKIFKDRGYSMANNLLIPGQPLKALKQMFNNMSADNAIYDFKEKEKLLDSIMRAAKFFIGGTKAIVNKKDTPLTSLTDSVRVLLQSVIADAKAKGIDEIVLPPIEKLAEKRFATGGNSYRKAITKGSGFHNTYVVAFDKALKQLQAELGNQIKVGTKDLKYRKAAPDWDDNAQTEAYIEAAENRVMAERFPRGDIAKKVAKADAEDFVILKGKSINIKDLKLDPKTSKLRFNKGGLVKGLMSR
jgi:hypothetical protein